MQTDPEQTAGPENSSSGDVTHNENEELIATSSEDGMRLDQFLVARFPDRSRAFFQRCVKDGAVRVDGRPCRSSFTLHANHLVTLHWPKETEYRLEGQEIAFGILYEDDDILVINKPPGLVVHPAEGNRNGTLVHGLLFHDEETFADMADESLRPGIVHRLDKDTSGVMVVAKSMAARRFLKDAFKEREVEKTYLTVVVGEFGSVTGTIENLIGRHPRNRTKMAVVSEDGKRALTKYRVLGTAMGCTLLEVRIYTGRTHQIRVHFSNLRHPVLGDSLYGGVRHDLPYQAKRQLLHAWKLVIPHPTTGVMREYMAPLPDDFREALEVMGLPMIGVSDEECEGIREKQISYGRNAVHDTAGG